LGHGTELYLKLDNFQRTGSFKARSALTLVASLGAERLRNGLVTMSAGNHAAAVAYAAACFGTTAIVVVPRSANPRKIAVCREYGAEVVLVDSVHAAPAMVESISERDGRVFIPPWGEPSLVLGTASIAVELIEQVPVLDAFVVAIGGGSVCAGVGPLLKKVWPHCEILAAEPDGAPTMMRSFVSGKPECIERIDTIADGLAPPFACGYFLTLCQSCVDQLSPMSDANIIAGMRFLFEQAKLAIEPAGAGAMGGALGPFRERIAGRRVGVMVSGSNIDLETFARLMS
jgi:threonine dehydratase